jgi:ubiquitin conjugation factor E4 B
LAFAKFPALLNGLVEDPSFVNKSAAPEIEKRTILGPFFRISPLQPEVTRVYFAAPRTMEQSRVRSSQEALQITLAAHQTDLKNVVNALIRASTEARNRTLDWFAHIMNVNHKRRAIQVDPKEVASDGFMMNVTVVLDHLCEPFMDTTFSKIDKIDIDYLRRSPRIDIKDETKINADQEQSDAFYSKKAEGTSNFISEVFFLTLAVHHYGSEATNSKMTSLDRDIKYYQKNIVMMEAERPKFVNRPDQLALLETTVKRHTDALEKAMSLKWAIEGVLLDEKVQARSLQFMRYVSIWLLRVATQTNYKPDSSLK